MSILKPLRIKSFEIEKPLIQGGMAVRISTSNLSAAVSEAGGLGIIGASGMDEEELRKEIREARKLTKAPIGVNIMVAISNFAELVRVSLEEKVDAIFAGAGFSRDYIDACKQTETAAVPIVSSIKAAKIAEKLGADAVVVESGDAGGHLGTSLSLNEIFREIKEELKIPVIAAGGLINKVDIEEAFNMGADAVQLGTIFAGAEESNAHPDFKKKYIEAREEDIVIIDSPAGLPGRAIMNEFVRKVAFGGEKHKPKFIKTCIKCLKKCKRNFCILDALISAQRGYVEEGIVFCGKKVSEFKKVMSVKEVFAELGF